MLLSIGSLRPDKPRLQMLNYSPQLKSAGYVSLCLFLIADDSLRSGWRAYAISGARAENHPQHSKPETSDYFISAKEKLGLLSQASSSLTDSSFAGGQPTAFSFLLVPELGDHCDQSDWTVTARSRT